MRNKWSWNGLPSFTDLLTNIVLKLFKASPRLNLWEYKISVIYMYIIALAMSAQSVILQLFWGCAMYLVLDLNIESLTVRFLTAIFGEVGPIVCLMIWRFSILPPISPKVKRLFEIWIGSAMFKIVSPGKIKKRYYCALNEGCLRAISVILLEGFFSSLRGTFSRCRCRNLRAQTRDAWTGRAALRQIRSDSSRRSIVSRQ